MSNHSFLKVSFSFIWYSDDAMARLASHPRENWGLERSSFTRNSAVKLQLFFSGSESRFMLEPARPSRRVKAFSKYNLCFLLRFYNRLHACVNATSIYTLLGCMAFEMYLLETFRKLKSFKLNDKNEFNLILSQSVILSRIFLIYIFFLVLHGLSN